MGSDHMRLCKHVMCFGYHKAFYLVCSSINAVKHNTAELLVNKTELTILYKTDIKGFRKKLSAQKTGVGIEPAITGR